MATAAQIEANRRNSQRSTGPKTNGGKARVRRNDLKHGLATFTIMPTLSQENPKRLDGRTQEWIDDVQPQNAIERDLTAQAARLTLDIERRRAHRACPTWPTGSFWPCGCGHESSARGMGIVPS